MVRLVLPEHVTQALVELFTRTGAYFNPDQPGLYAVAWNALSDRFAPLPDAHLNPLYGYVHALVQLGVAERRMQKLPGMDYARAEYRRAEQVTA